MNSAFDQLVVLLKKFISFTSITLKRFIFTATLIVSAVTFVTVIATVSWIFLRQAGDISARNSSAMSRQILGSISQAMEEGRTLADMAKTLESYQRSFSGRYAISIHPGKTINPSAPSLSDKNSNVIKAFSEGTTIQHRSFNSLEYVFPLKSEAKCLGCHPTARIGEVLGVLAINEDISADRNTFLQKIFLCFFLLLPIPFLMSFSVSRFVNAHVGDAVARLHRKVHSVNSIADLTKLEMELENEEHTFRELENIFGEFSVFVSRIKDVAVGKEMLEFEIKVLERFIITSETIRDWKERVGFLLSEVNKVMPAYTIFCIFQIEEEIFDIEVFWTNPPSASTERIMEEIINMRVSQEKLSLTSVAAIKVIHNIVNAHGPTLELDRNEIELQTKSLFLEKRM